MGLVTKPGMADAQITQYLLLHSFRYLSEARGEGRGTGRGYRERAPFCGVLCAGSRTGVVPLLQKEL